MKAVKTTALAFAVAALATAATPVLAASASASLSDVRIQLIDLDPSDGIAPGISFGAPGVWAYAMTNPTGRVSDFEFINVFKPIGSSATAQSTAGAAWGEGKVFAFDPFLGTGLAATAQASASGAFAEASGDAFALYADFVLTPMTKLVVSATASPSFNVVAGSGELAMAWATIRVESPSGQWLVESQTFQVVDGRGTGNAFLVGTPHLELAFDNATDAAFNGHVNAMAIASATAPVTSVPEPTTSLMMLVGLAGLAARVRRRWVG